MVPRDPVWEAARALEPDRYLAALYAPEPGRRTLMALAAFQGEIARIPMTVREPLLAEIKLQWWRDALQMLMQDNATGHPVADALAEGLRSGRLPIGLAAGMIDAAAEPRAISAWSDPQALRSHLHKGHGAAFTLAARALGATYSQDLEAAAQTSGLAYGLARSLANQPHGDGAARAALIARCRTALPGAVSAVSRLDSALLPGFLPLAMVRAYLWQASSQNTDVSALQRWWRLWRAQVSGRLA